MTYAKLCDLKPGTSIRHLGESYFRLFDPVDATPTSTIQVAGKHSILPLHPQTIVEVIAVPGTGDDLTSFLKQGLDECISAVPRGAEVLKSTLMSIREKLG